MEMKTFAKKWLMWVKDSKASKTAFMDSDFGRECSELGFEADHGESFIRIYGQAYYDEELFGFILPHVKDVMLLGSAMYSRWTDKNIDWKWMKLALERLDILSNKKVHHSHIFIRYHEDAEDIEEMLSVDLKHQTLEYAICHYGEWLTKQEYLLDDDILTAIKEIDDFHGEKDEDREEGFYDIEVHFDNKTTWKHSYEVLPQQWQWLLMEIQRYISTIKGDMWDVEENLREYRFCFVSFGTFKPYCYLCDDPTIEVGDYVVVPAGRMNKENIVEVKKIGMYTRFNAPFNPRRTKHVIRKCTDLEVQNYLQETE